MCIPSTKRTQRRSPRKMYGEELRVFFSSKKRRHRAWVDQLSLKKYPGLLALLSSWTPTGDALFLHRCTRESPRHHRSIDYILLTPPFSPTHRPPLPDLHASCRGRVTPVQTHPSLVANTVPLYMKMAGSSALCACLSTRGCAWATPAALPRLLSEAPKNRNVLAFPRPVYECMDTRWVQSRRNHNRKGLRLHIL